MKRIYHPCPQPSNNPPLIHPNDKQSLPSPHIPSYARRIIRRGNNTLPPLYIDIYRCRCSLRNLWRTFSPFFPIPHHHDECFKFIFLYIFFMNTFTNCTMLSAVHSRQQSSNEACVEYTAPCYCMFPPPPPPPPPAAAAATPVPAAAAATAPTAPWNGFYGYECAACNCNCCPVSAHNDDSCSACSPLPQEQFKASFYNPFEVKHRRRTTRGQFKVLERTFLENPKPNNLERKQLAQRLNMTPRGVQVWFQNRRAKAKAQQRRLHQEKMAAAAAATSASTATAATAAAPAASTTTCSSSTLAAVAPTPVSQSAAEPAYCSQPLPPPPQATAPAAMERQASTTSSRVMDDDNDLLQTPLTPQDMFPFFGDSTTQFSLASDVSWQTQPELGLSCATNMLSSTPSLSIPSFSVTGGDCLDAEFFSFVPPQQQLDIMNEVSSCCYHVNYRANANLSSDIHAGCT